MMYCAQRDRFVTLLFLAAVFFIPAMTVISAVMIYMVRMRPLSGYDRPICNRAGRYIFALWFLLSIYLLSFFSSPNLSGRRVDVYHTSTHGVALVRI